MRISDWSSDVCSSDLPDAAFDLGDLDPELVDISVEEAGDLLDHSDGLLAQLRESPTEREALVGLQRGLHTIKGGDRKSDVEGKSGSVRVDHGGCRSIKTNKRQ